jgi:hypothetical protein
LLSLAPWTLLWRRNAFLIAMPWLGAVMNDPFVRGAVTGVGLVTFAAGLRDLASVFFARRPVVPTAPDDLSRRP